jgi:hypothetical protein
MRRPHYLIPMFIFVHSIDLSDQSSALATPTTASRGIRPGYAYRTEHSAPLWSRSAVIHRTLRFADEQETAPKLDA